MKKINLFFVVAVLLIGFVFAGHSFTTYNIESEYGPGEPVTGWVEMGFTNEPANYLFEDNNGNSISLDKLLILNSLESSCSNANCLPTYSFSNGAVSKIFTLSSGESKIIGLKLTGNIESIDLMNFNVSSDAGVSCDNQIEVDFFSDDKVELMNTRASSEVCGTNSYGCFDVSESTSDLIIGSDPYCQEIELVKAPGFRVGTYVMPDSEPRVLEMFVHNGSKKIGNMCNLPSMVSAGEYSCEVNLSITENENNYICVRSTGGDGYKTLGYSDSNGCGFLGTPPKSKVFSYKIFAQPRKYDAVGNLETPNAIVLKKWLEDYLKKTYGEDMVCPAEGCVVPIKINSKMNQQVTFKDLNLKYSVVGATLQESKLYDLDEIPSNVNLVSKKIYLDSAGFNVSKQFGESVFELKFDGNKLFSQKIDVKEVAIISSVSPMTTIAGLPVTFNAFVKVYDKNITEYKWEFGEDSKTTDKGKIIYTFDSIGLYNLKISITDSAGKVSSKTFQINVTSPKDSLGEIIEGKINDLDNLKKQLEDFSLFEQVSLKEELDLKNIEEQLIVLQVSFSNDTNDEKAIEIMKSLSSLEIPKSISVDKKLDFFDFVFNPGDIDLDFLAEVGRENNLSYTTNKDIFLNAIMLWNTNNLDTKIQFKEFSATYDSGEKHILSFFDLNIHKKTDFSYPVFLVVDSLEDVSFSEEFEEKGSFNYYELLDSQIISISTTEDIDFTNLPVFISPEMIRLSVQGEPIVEEKISKWIYFGIIIFLLLVIGVVIYLYLQKWYKTKYEDYLFKNKNDLYNLLVFIENAKRKKASERDILRELKKSGWSGEQLKYALKKSSGDSVKHFAGNKSFTKFSKKKF